MYVFEDFMEHFNKRHYCMKTPEKKARDAFALYFDGVSPERVDLITHKLIQRNTKLWETSRGGRFNYHYNIVEVPFRKERNLAFHELGHVVDYIRTDKVPRRNCPSNFRYDPHFYSRDTVLSTGKTLHQTVKEEVKAKAAEIYDMLCLAYRKELLDLLDKDLADAYELCGKVNNALSSVKDKYRCFKNKESAEGRAMQEEIQRLEGIVKEHGYFKGVHVPVHKTEAYKAFDLKYDILLDMLSGAMDTRSIFSGHSRSYMNAKGGFGCEFFANMFAAETMGLQETLTLTAQYLPDSYAAYRELYGVVLRQFDEPVAPLFAAV